jgi:hypothetical protein
MWCSCKGPALLYVTARLGCGKTTIAAHVIQYIESKGEEIAKGEQPFDGENEADHKPLLLYFFFQDGYMEAKGTATAALRTMINQLIHQVPSLYPLVLRQYEFLSTRENFSWTWDSLWSVFFNILSHIGSSQSIYMVIDAADECYIDLRETFITSLNSLVSNTESWSPLQRRPVAKIIITGRPDEQILDIISHPQVLEITNSDTEIDMQALIDFSVESFAHRCRLAPEVYHTISSFLKSNAEGMFRWVVLIMKELKRRNMRLTDEVVAAKLSIVPPTLTTAYKSILKCLPKVRQDDCWRVFRWLIYSRKVMTPDELEKALCLELGIPKWPDFIGELRFFCGSFIRIEADGIHLVHQTAREFLHTFIQKAPPYQVGGVEMDAAHAESQLATMCIQYMLEGEKLALLGEWADNTTLDNVAQKLQAYLDDNPFLAYAADFWAAHLETIESPADQLSSLAMALLSIEKNRDMLMCVVYFSRSGIYGSPYGASPLHLAAYFRLPWLIKLYLSQGTDPNILSGADDTPLTWASEAGSAECVQLLLEAGADPNLAEYDGWSPLHWAATNGHLKVVELLLDYGADMTARDDNDLSPSDWALRKGYSSIAELIQKHPPSDLSLVRIPAQRNEAEDDTERRGRTLYCSRFGLAQPLTPRDSVVQSGGQNLVPVP